MTGIYDHPWVYELACGFRDVPAEAGAILRWCERHRQAGGAPRNVLELAAGPAEHAREFARLGIDATALDLNPAMCAYAKERAMAGGVDLDVAQADMTAFSLRRRYDLAVTMADSTAHLRTLDDFVAHLRCVARHLTGDGLYVLDMAHPADRLSDTPRSDREWRQERDGIVATVRWGEPADVLDPVTQLINERVTVRVERTGETTEIRDVVPYRFWTATETEAAIRLSGTGGEPGLTVAARYGGFAGEPFDSDTAWRMIIVLARA